MLLELLIGVIVELLVIFKGRTNKYLLSAFKELKDTVRFMLGIKSHSLDNCSQDFDKAVYEFPYRSMTDDFEGDRICQLLIRRREKIQWEEVETLEELGTTERGEGGFGSTGGDGETKTEEFSKIEEVDDESAKVSGTTQNRFAK